MSAIDSGQAPTIYDDALRWTVCSRTDPHVTYVVDLGSFGGNGECPCDDFRFNFGAILARGISAERAVELKLVTVREWQRVPRNALRCWHIMEGGELYERACSAHMQKNRG